MRHSYFTGWGSYLPDRICTNDELGRRLGKSADWIKKRTGINQRHIATETETTTTMAIEAARRALEVAHLNPEKLDLIIVATSTPAEFIPSTACRVQHAIGATGAGAFDLSAACSGFMYGVNMAAQSIATGFSQNALVVGAETVSRVLDWTDLGTSILFGDGAGAVVLEGSDVPGGILASTLGADGSGGNNLVLPAISPADNAEFPDVGGKRSTMKMNGLEIFRFATRIIVTTIQEILDKTGLTIEDVDLIIPHQSNIRIIESAAKRLKVSPQRFFTNLECVGNTSAASIPLALCHAVNQNRLKPGDIVIFIGFGGGVTWAANVIKWGVPTVKSPVFAFEVNNQLLL